MKYYSNCFQVYYEQIVSQNNKYQQKINISVTFSFFTYALQVLFGHIKSGEIIFPVKS